MKERGINNTFKKIIFESTEMVFLADDTYPYNIFYNNQIFEDLVGQFLDERSLVGLGLDINSYLFNEELILRFMGVDYTFNLELPQENGSNYFLFYKGKEMRGQGLPTKKEAHYFFRNSVDLIAIGQENYLTWVSNSVKSILGYPADEVINIELCEFFHKDDVEYVKSLVFDVKDERKNTQFTARLLNSVGEYRWMEFNIHFIVGKFYAVGHDVTDNKKQLAEKENKNKLFKSGEKLASIAFWEQYLTDKKWTVTPEFFSLMQIPDTVELSFDRLVNAAVSHFRPVLQDSFAKLVNEGIGFEFEFQLLLDQPQPLWIRMIGQSIQVEGRTVKVFGSIQDISASKNQLEEVSLFKSLLEASPDFLLISDLTGQIIFANQRVQNLLSLKNTKKYQIWDIEKVFENPEIWEGHLNQIAIDGPKSYTGFYLLPSGKKMELDIHSSIVHVKGKNYLIAQARDISDKVILTKNSGQSVEVLKHLTEQIPGALYQFTVDTEGEMKFNYISAGIKDLLEIGDDDFSEFNDVGNIISLVYPEDLPKVLTSTVTSARKLSPWTCKFRVKTSRNTSYKWVLGSAKPFQLESGDVVWYGYLNDVTSQMSFEDHLQKAKEDALKASKVKSEFLSIVSHELRTPLNAISGSVYSLMQDEHTQGQASAFQTINFAVDSLMSMINDLLDFQKIEVGKLTLEKTTVNLSELLAQIVSSLEHHAKETQNQLSWTADFDVNVDVRTDKVRLTQVLNNLLTNALKFTDKGQVEVNLSLKDNTKDKIKVYFEVKDTGIGIAKENIARLFSEYDQIQQSYSKKYGGTGLGLSITKKILNLMGSDVGVISELGVGSSFFFELEFERVYKEPALKEAPTVERPKVNGNASPEEVIVSPPANVISNIKKPVDVNQIKLLMAEDNDVNALVLGKILKKWGMSYKRVNNGKEAVEAVKNELFDCVLMDIQMPIMNGFDATQKIKEFSSVPVLALSAADKLEYLDKMEEIGFEGYVSKPIDASELLKKIKEVLMISHL
ncbi:PAS domain-containing hybrid sensor histidine kinase/response regulator [Mongoliitalea daihaiensis]|uniref:PAS domain-containing hybrid sensor histidine kinase/response regulator n=1 Tax=Mongoliitalea daihaiensis TaxID=2782006 RepID=UPI001F260DC9|nr:ATP-binding protein [Mongoliitalea daihaiensis]UJP64823.1 response regulator [Mongoliitalea daihaiensis]